MAESWCTLRVCPLNGISFNPQPVSSSSNDRVTFVPHKLTFLTPSHMASRQSRKISKHLNVLIASELYDSSDLSVSSSPSRRVRAYLKEQDVDEYHIDRHLRFKIAQKSRCANGLQEIAGGTTFITASSGRLIHSVYVPDGVLFGVFWSWNCRNTVILWWWWMIKFSTLNVVKLWETALRGILCLPSWGKNAFCEGTLSGHNSLNIDFWTGTQFGSLWTLSGIWCKFWMHFILRSDKFLCVLGRLESLNLSSNPQSTHFRSSYGVISAEILFETALRCRSCIFTLKLHSQTISRKIDGAVWQGLLSEQGFCRQFTVWNPYRWRQHRECLPLDFLSGPAVLGIFQVGWLCGERFHILDFHGWYDWTHGNWRSSTL